MRTDRSALSWLGALLALAPALLAGCPGTLDNKDAFESYTAGASAGGGAGLADGAAGDSSDAGAAGVAGASTIDLGPCGDVVMRIFVPSCGGTGCHGATAPQQGLDLVSPGVASRVVGVAGKGCTGTLADPSNPANSLMYTKLSTKPPCGAQMPLARPPLSGDDEACMLDWIASQ